MKKNTFQQLNSLSTALLIFAFLMACFTMFTVKGYVQYKRIEAQQKAKQVPGTLGVYLNHGFTLTY